MAQAIIGRDRELDQVEQFLDRLPDGSAILLIDGEPGVGKTALWLDGRRRAHARGWRIPAARPTDAEATFAYAGLGDLLEPGLDEALAPLPLPQQRALGVALLRQEPGEPAPDPGTVAVAFLNALRGLAATGPVVVAVDDVQWLDAPSASALAFAIRRLGEEPVGFLLALRREGSAGLPLGLDRPPTVDRLARLHLGPMQAEALGRLLQERLGTPFGPTTLHRIESAAAGNPFFALELGCALGSAGGGLRVDDDLPMPAVLLDLVGERIAALPDATRDTLGIAALAAHPTVRLLARIRGESVEADLRPALDAHVVEVDVGRVRFAHPLQAAVARAGIDPGRRRDLHARLAELVGDPEERARHLALAIDGPDEAVAAELEQAARRARARGAPEAASELAALARRVTPAERPADAKRRALAEAEHAMVAGDAARARAIGEEVLADAPAGPGRAEALVLLAQVAVFGLDLHDAIRVLREALAEVGGDDRLRMRCEGLLTAALDRLGEDVPAALEHGRAELRLAERLGDQVHVATALRGLARNEQRHTGRMPLELIERALALEPVVRASRSVIEWPTVCHAEMLSWTDDLAGGLRAWEWLRAQAIERGEEQSLALVLERLSWFESVAGRWAQARAHAEEGRSLAAAAGQVASEASLVADLALVGALVGSETAARQDATVAMRLAGHSGANDAERTARWAMGLLELAAGSHADAAEWLLPLVAGARAAGVAEPGALRFVPDAAEALIGADRLEDAAGLVAWHGACAEASGRVHALASGARAAGLLLAARGERDAGLARLEASRALYASIDEPFGRARTLLALGSIRRRALERREARTLLEAAEREFVDLGADRWAALARNELERISGRRAAGSALTPAEREVAALVAEGRTNREVAAALFLAERTVEGHLSSVYAKLGIRSRTELARTFGRDGTD